MKIQFFPFRTGVQPKISSSAVLAISYLILSVVWIMLGDSLAAEVAGNDTVLYEKIQSLKGLFFIVVSAVFLYLFSRKLYLGIELSHLKAESVQKKYQALNEAAREGLFEYDYKENKASLNTKMKFFFPADGNEIPDFWQNCQRRIHPDDMERLSRECTLADEGVHGLSGVYAANPIQAQPSRTWLFAVKRVRAAVPYGA